MMITRRILVWAIAVGIFAAPHSKAIAQVFARNSAGTQGPLASCQSDLRGQHGVAARQAGHHLGLG